MHRRTILKALTLGLIFPAKALTGLISKPQIRPCTTKVLHGEPPDLVCVRCGEATGAEFVTLYKDATSYSTGGWWKSEIMTGCECLCPTCAAKHHYIAGQDFLPEKTPRLFLDGKDITNEAFECDFVEGWAKCFKVDSEDNILDDGFKPYKLVKHGTLTLRRNNA